MKTRKVMIIGTGNVGAAAAHAFVNGKFIEELILVDLKTELVDGHQKDLADAASFLPYKMTISTREVSDAKDVDIAVISVAAGIIAAGDTRLDELKNTSKIMEDIIPKMMKGGFNGIFLVVTNPCDIITYQVWKLSGLPKERAIGTGVWLDTTRLRRILAEELNIAAHSINAFILGEHGDSQFPVWSHSSIYGMKVDEYSKRKHGNSINLTKIGERTRDMGFEIYYQKDCTAYGIANTIVDVCQHIFTNSRRMIPVSCVLTGEYGQTDLAIGVPAVLSQSGIAEIVTLNLNEKEQLAFENSVNIIKRNIDQLNL